MNGNNVNSSIPFVYLVTSATLATGATGSYTLTFQADSNFELFAFTGSSSAQDPTDYSPNEFRVKITDQTTGRALASGAIDQRLLCGDAFNGLIQVRPVVFVAQSTLLFDVTNLNAGDNVIKIALHGYKNFL